MQRISVTDEWLYQYMPIVDEALVRELEENTDYEYRFSGRFERRMKRQIRREAHPWIGVFGRASKKAAIVFLCAASTLFAITMSVQAYRIKFFETVKTIWEDSVSYSYKVDQDQSQSTIRCNEPGFIPEGYQETERTTSKHWLSIVYTAPDGKTITWDQMLVQDGGEWIFDIEYDQQIAKEVNGRNVIISLYSEGCAYAYCEYGECVYLLTTDDLSVDEICLIFESVTTD